MVCACSLYFNIVYFITVYGYPGYKVKTGKQEKLWLLYFLILGAFSILENSLFYIFKWLLNKICFCMFPSVKALFFLWLYYPKTSGIFKVESIIGKYIDMAYQKINPIAGKYLEKLGIANKGSGNLSGKKIMESINSAMDTTISSVNSAVNNLRSEPPKKEHAIPYYRKLNNGIEMPVIGLGSSRIQNIVDVVYGSVKDGLRLIDTAKYYKNEEEIGKGLRKVLDEGIVKREELFIIGKLWIEDRKDPEAGLRETLKKLQLDYVDMYLDHWPSGNNYGDPNAPKQVPIFEMWPKMEQLVEKGLTRSIGVSNYNVQSLLNLLSFCKIKPVANEVEFHPYYYQEGLKNFCDKEDIVLITYYPLAKGNGAKVYNKEHNDEMDSFKEKAVVELAEKYGKTPGQIILNWHLAQGCIPIPGTSNPKRFRENLASLDFKLTDDEVKRLCVYGKKMKFCGCRRFFDINILA